MARHVHANDAARPRAAVNLARLAHLHGQAIVTVDMDATAYDAWACCGVRGNFRSAKDCTHLREDTIAKVEDVIARTGAVPVVLSWRAGLVDTTIKWLADCNIAVRGHTDGQLDAPRLTMEAVFIPGSDDDVASLAWSASLAGEVDHQANRARWGSGQVAFKAGTVTVLQSALEVTVAACFDDNGRVVDALAKLGAAEPVVVEHLVEIKPHEWAAGRIGAPKPSRPAYRPYSGRSGASQAAFDLGGWDEPIGGYDPVDDGDVPPACAWCETALAVDGDGLCTDCGGEVDALYDDGEFGVGDRVTLDSDRPGRIFEIVQYDEFGGYVLKDDDGDLVWASDGLELAP